MLFVRADALTALFAPRPTPLLAPATSCLTAVALPCADCDCPSRCAGRLRRGLRAVPAMPAGIYRTAAWSYCWRRNPAATAGTAPRHTNCATACFTDHYHTAQLCYLCSSYMPRTHTSHAHVLSAPCPVGQLSFVYSGPVSACSLLTPAFTACLPPPVCKNKTTRVCPL